MTEIGTRLQKLRQALCLSQEYLAQQLNISQAAVSQIERGKRKVTSRELAVLSRIYGISANELLAGRESEPPIQVFTKKFAELDEVDQQEVFSLLEFKRRIKEYIAFRVQLGDLYGIPLESFHKLLKNCTTKIRQKRDIIYCRRALCRT